MFPGSSSKSRLSDRRIELNGNGRLPTLSRADIAAIQTCVSQRVLRWFVRRGWLDPDEARAMRDWHNDGGFSLGYDPLAQPEPEIEFDQRIQRFAK